ncbi:uncharacterized protein LOC125229001 [Leguminivora glycinivorella]|uniref:uncharacterized protein LOC125229001 n=1 Tax=Leguminivora glycinivorella TaxID=1035111 RepID=UPI00200F720B|nr:uncharacterized protein LOC125229001 [Leguminivora glycinivorella]
MLISRVSFLLILQLSYSEATLEINLENDYSMAKECVKRIIKAYYDYEVLTFINFNARSQEILQAIHETNSVSIITRALHEKSPLYNRGYFIYVLNADDFLSHFYYLKTEGTWKPDAPFMVVVEHLQPDDLLPMFRELLWVHVAKVVIIDALTTNAYSYDPYSNQGCGKRFDSIIELGKCFIVTPPFVFSNASKSILRNCTLQVAATNWPPFTIDRTKNDVKTIGMDEYIFSVFSELEHINVNITYFEELSDVVSNVSQDMVATGPLGWLQANKFDVVTGCQILLPSRAEAFEYLYGHLAFDDYFAVFVRKSGLLAHWKVLTLVFTPIVWFLLLVTFLIVAILVIFVSKSKDKVVMVFCLVDNLLMHTCRIRKTNRILYILLFSWILFSCLIPYHYLSILYSLTAKPVNDYQIGTISDMYKYELRPCISDAVLVMHRMILDNNSAYFNDLIAHQLPLCATLSSSLEKVAKSDDMFTVVPYYMYYSVKYNYFDSHGRDLLYPFHQRLGKIIYGTYMYKGFPLRDKLFMQTTWMHAAGLTLKVWQDYVSQQAKLFQIKELKQQYNLRVLVPWQIIVIGSSISTLCFLGEIVTNYFKSIRTSNIVKIR